jgi:hypothetical protein
MTKGYIWDECLGFVIDYLQRFDVVKWCIWDVDEEEGDTNEVLEANSSWI